MTHKRILDQLYYLPMGAKYWIWHYGLRAKALSIFGRSDGASAKSKQ